jgi:elongation factor G
MVPGPLSPRIRNLGILAHIDAGKTTVSERFLFYTGVERRMGEVHHGTAVMDWMEEERKRGITITSAVTTMPWRGHQLNLIDTPGHVDFTVEVERSLRVLDGAILVLAGPAGVQAQSETVWRQMQRHRIPALGFLNQWDRADCDLASVLAQLRTRLGIEPALVQMPIGSGVEYCGWVDLVEMRAWHVDHAAPGRAAEVVERALDADLALEAGVLRSELIDAIAEVDDDIAALVIEGQEPGPGALSAALRRATLARSILPIFVGSAMLGIGIPALLDGVIDYLPGPALGLRGLAQAMHIGEPASPEAALHAALMAEPAFLDSSSQEASNQESGESPDVDAPALLIAYKFMVGSGAPLCFARIYQGTLRAGDALFNARTQTVESVHRLVRMHADHREPLIAASAGELVAIEGFELTRTGDVLTAADSIPGATLEQLARLAGLAIPRPVISRVVEPETEADRAALIETLMRLELEDPSFRAREDLETGQWILSGMGELHLEIIEGRLVKDFGLAVRAGSPRVAYREVLTKAARGRGLVDRDEEVGGAAAGYAVVRVAVEPRAEDTGIEVVWTCAVDVELRQPIEGALLARARSGVRYGYPLEGARIVVEAVELQAGRVHPAVCALAAALALGDAAQRGAIALFEPVMRFEVVAPEEFAGGIMADLLAHGTTIHEVRSEGRQRILIGQAPLFAMFGYSTSLRSLSQGRASMGLELGGFQELPQADLLERGLAWS